MGKRIFDSRDLTTASNEILKSIDKAVLSAALEMKENARNAFISSKPMYDVTTERYDNLKKGIIVGRLQNKKVKLHALGDREGNTWKTRFFVGGTMYRGNHGYIKSNDAIDKGVDLNILTQKINQAIEEQTNGK